MPRPTPPAGRLVLIRHGETAWSLSGQHTGRTDIALTERGERLARRLPELLGDYAFVQILCSPLRRASDTAALAGLVATPDADLMEWDYGGYEGISTPDIESMVGYEWQIFHDGVIPGGTPGETLQEVAARARRVVDRITPILYDGDVALVAHGHLLRILATVFLRQEARFGAALLLDAGAVCELRWDRGTPGIQSWNRTLRD